MDWGNLAQILGAGVGLLGFLTSLWAARSKRFDDKIDAVAKDAKDALEKAAKEIREEAAASVTKLETADSAVRADISRVFQRVDTAEQRVTRVENELAHLPNKDMVHALQIAMTDLKGQMAVVIERVGPIKAIAERMQEVLLEHPPK